jgi:hypothetical protein
LYVSAPLLFFLPRFLFAHHIASRRVPGFPDEDPERRAHVARLDQLYAEDVRVSVSSLASSTAKWSGVLPGVTSAAALAAAVAAQSGPEAGALAAQQTEACVRFEDAAEAPSVEAPAEAAGSSGVAGSWWKTEAELDGGLASPAAPGDAAATLDLQHMLNVVRSTWATDEVAAAEAEREMELAAQLLPHEAAQRALVRDLIAVAPIAPAFQTQQQQQPPHQQHAGGSAAAVASTAFASASARAAPSRRRSADVEAQRVENGLRASIAALEADRRRL